MSTQSCCHQTEVAQHHEGLICGCVGIGVNEVYQAIEQLTLEKSSPSLLLETLGMGKSCPGCKENSLNIVSDILEIKKKNV